jgi:hypothetical protein
MKWACGVFIVMWLVFLTIISTDLNYKYNESEKRNDEMIIMIREYKEEIEKRDNRLESIINSNKEEAAHALEVHEQIISAQIKGISKEW